MDTRRIARSMLTLAISTTPLAASATLKPICRAKAASARSPAAKSSAIAPAQKMLRVQPPEDGVGVAQRHRLATEPVDDRPRIGARRFRTDAQGAARVNARQRTAARADRFDI